MLATAWTADLSFDDDEGIASRYSSGDSSLQDTRAIICGFSRRRTIAHSHSPFVALNALNVGVNVYS